jgi:protein-tyrosine phosphatase
MDNANIRDMHRICGGDYAGKIRRLPDESNHRRDVADLWYTGDFGQTWLDAEEGCLLLLKALTA